MGYYDINGVYHDTFIGDETFVGFGKYGADSTATFDGGTLNQSFNGVVVGTATDIWSDANNDIMIAGGDKLQTNHHSAVYGDYTVSEDANAHNFDFSFSGGSGGSSNFLDYVNDHSVDNIMLTYVTDTGDANYYSSDAPGHWTNAYLAWVDSLTGGTYTSLTDAEAAATKAGWSFSQSNTVEAFNNQDTDSGLDNGDNGAGHFITDNFEAMKTGSFDAVNPTNNLILDFAVGTDHLTLTTGSQGDTSLPLISMTDFESNFHVASVNESGNWAGLVNNSNADPSTLTTPSTMIYTEDNNGHINWSVTLLGVHLGDLAGVDASAGDSAANKDAVYADLVGHS